MNYINIAPLPLASHRVQLTRGTAGDWRLEQREAEVFIPPPHPQLQPKQVLLVYRLAVATFLYLRLQLLLGEPSASATAPSGF